MPFDFDGIHDDNHTTHDLFLITKISWFPQCLRQPSKSKRKREDGEEDTAQTGVNKVIDIHFFFFL